MRGGCGGLVVGLNKRLSKITFGVPFRPAPSRRAGISKTRHRFPGALPETGFNSRREVGKRGELLSPSSNRPSPWPSPRNGERESGLAGGGEAWRTTVAFEQPPLTPALSPKR